MLFANAALSERFALVFTAKATHSVVNAVTTNIQRDSEQFRKVVNYCLEMELKKARVRSLLFLGVNNGVRSFVTLR